MKIYTYPKKKWAATNLNILGTWTTCNIRYLGSKGFKNRMILC